VDEGLLPRKLVHGGDEGAVVVDGGRVEPHGNVSVAHAERRHEAGLVGEAVLRIEQAQVDDGGVAFGGDVAELLLRGLTRGPEAIVDRDEVPDVGDRHDRNDSAWYAKD